MRTISLILGFSMLTLIGCGSTDTRQRYPSAEEDRDAMKAVAEVNFVSAKATCDAIDAKTRVGTPKEIRGCQNRQNLVSQGFPMPPE